VFEDPARVPVSVKRFRPTGSRRAKALQRAHRRLVRRVIENVFIKDQAFDQLLGLSSLQPVYRDAISLGRWKETPFTLVYPAENLGRLDTIYGTARFHRQSVLVVTGRGGLDGGQE
jgi:hypothetical protein